MDIFNLLPTIFSVLGVAFAAFAMHKSSSSLKHRLKIERKLARTLADELRRRNIESQVSFELNKLQVKGKISEEQDADQIKEEIHAAIRCAIQQLVEEEQTLIKESLDQPSKQGQSHYIRKLLSNSLDQISHQKA